MPAILDDQLTLDQIKNHPGVLGIYLSRAHFTKNGSEYETRCLFHDEKTASLKLNNKDGRWLWFCQGGACTTRGGSIVDFIMESDHVLEGAAIRKIKEELGIEHSDSNTSVRPLAKTLPNSQDQFTKQKPFITITLKEYAILERKLATNPAAIEWLKMERGLSYEVCQRLHLGFRQTIKARDESLQDILNRGWFCFPSIEGDRVVSLKYRSIVRKAFSRKWGMETELFNAEATNPSEDLYVTAGEWDTMCLEQAEFHSVSIGSDKTPITPEIKKQLELAGRLILAGDSDESGDRAMDKLQDLFPEALRLRWPDSIKDAQDLWDKYRKSNKTDWLDELEGVSDLHLFRKKVLELTVSAVHKTPVAVVEVVDTPVQPVFPDMPDSVLDGRLGEICQRRLGKLPLAYAWPALVTCAGVLVPLPLAFDSESCVLDIPESDETIKPLRTNLYFCAVGPQGSGKSQVIEQALSCLGVSKHNGLVKGKWGSAEGMLTAISKIKSTGIQKLLFPGEMGHLLAKANIENSSYSYILNDFYYDDYIQLTMAKQQTIEVRCRMSLAGGVVEKLFGESFGSATIGGLYDRFIFGLCPEPYNYLWRPYDTKVEKLNPVVVDTHADVWECRDDWVRNNPDLQSRITENALKVASICAAFDGRKVLRGKDLGPALEFAKYQTRVRVILQPNPGLNQDAMCAFAIARWLASHTPTGHVLRLTLYKGIHGERFGPGVFDRALKNLVFNGSIGQGRIGSKATVFLLGSHGV